MQREANHPSEAPAIVHEALSSPGQPLDASTRASMERRFNHDFSQVRVHTGPQASESARAVNAQAYTVGQDVAFGAGNYTPGTERGRRLLAHELTHVVQQSRNGRPLMAKSSLDIAPPEDSCEREADAVAQTMIFPQNAHETPSLARSPLVKRVTSPLLQRKLVINPTDSIPLPAGQSGPPTPLTIAIQGLLQDTCPDGHFAVDKAGNVTPANAEFCQQPPPPPPWLAADVSSTPVGCGCICDVINSAQTATIAFSPGGPGTSPGSVPGAGPGQGGVAADPTVSVDPRFHGQYFVAGRWVDIPFHLIFSHELCGHALPKMKGTHVARGPGVPGGTPPQEQHAVDVERQIAAEHNPPLPRRPDDYAGAARERP